jgi:hypothetical protein
VAADAPNEIDWPKDVVSEVGNMNGSIEIGVAVDTKAGETSSVAVSKAFDTIDAGTPRIVSFTPSGIMLQARNTRTSPWYAVDGYDFTDHTYRFAVPSREPVSSI